MLKYFRRTSALRKIFNTKFFPINISYNENFPIYGIRLSSLEEGLGTSNGKLGGAWVRGYKLAPVPVWATPIHLLLAKIGISPTHEKNQSGLTKNKLHHRSYPYPMAGVPRNGLVSYI